MEQTNDSKLAELVKWPNEAKDMTADLMLRIIGADTQRAWLANMDAMDESIRASVKQDDGFDTSPMRTPLYLMRTQTVIGAVGLMAAIRALKAIDPAKADEFARDYWSMCDAGDSFGEMLWEFTADAGLDPELVKAAHVAAPEQCEWKHDDAWRTTCGLTWGMDNDATPAENQMAFCPKCGKRLVVVERQK